MLWRKSKAEGEKGQTITEQSRSKELSYWREGAVCSRRMSLGSSVLIAGEGGGVPLPEPYERGVKLQPWPQLWETCNLTAPVTLQLSWRMDSSVTIGLMERKESLRPDWSFSDSTASQHKDDFPVPDQHDPSLSHSRTLCPSLLDTNHNQSCGVWFLRA